MNKTVPRSPTATMIAACPHAYPADLISMWQAMYDAAPAQEPEWSDDLMCPNCVTPWKCNGPHIPQDVKTAPAAAPDALLPEFIRKRLERECEAAEHPKGMSTHDGYCRVQANDLRRALQAAAPSAPAQDRADAAQALLAAERERAGRMESSAVTALKIISAWDCLNPPRTDLLADLGWLRRVVEAALKEGDC